MIFIPGAGIGFLAGYKYCQLKNFPDRNVIHHPVYDVMKIFKLYKQDFRGERLNREIIN